MKKSNFYLILLIFNVFRLNAAEVQFPTSAIIDSLKENALAVVREDYTNVNIKSWNNVDIKEKYVVTILKAQGDKYGYKRFYYRNNSRITKLNAILYNSKGEVVKKYYKADFHDFAYDPYGIIETDLRCIESEIYYNNYPYTVEYNVTHNNKHTFIPDWLPINNFNLSVEKSSYTISYPANFKLRYKESNLPTTIVHNSSETRESWQIKNIPALRKISYMPDLRMVTPYIRLEPTEFVYEGYSGSLESWKEYGKFSYQLNQGRQTIPLPLKEKIDDLTDTCTSDLSRMKVLYSYLQNNTRYISIQVGIGGHQPMPAESVFNDGYGDCKALSNYMVALLNYVGIKSYYTLVQSGRGNYYFDSKFVSDQFNHIIVSIPREIDTLWLECTNQQMPFGFLGDFTDNRPALMITDEGGKLVRTTVYNKKDNLINREITINLSDDKDAKAETSSEYHGLMYDDMYWISIEDVEEQKKMLYEQLNIPNFTIVKFKLKSTDGPSPVLLEQLSLTLKNYTSKAGSRIFVPVIPINSQSYIPEKNTTREQPIYKKFDRTNSQTIKIIIPENTEVEALPPDADINTKYGSYKRVIKQENGYILCSRKLEVNKGTFLAAEYDEFREFYKSIAKYEDDMLVLKKTN